MATHVEFVAGGLKNCVRVDRLVLKQRDSTQAGTTYYAMEMGELETDPYSAVVVGEVERDEFFRIKKMYPRTRLIRAGVD